MARGTNFFFRNVGLATNYSAEAELFQNLCDEMIQIHGFDCYYIIRNTNYIDPLLEEAPTSTFTNAIPLEFYLDSYEGFAGAGDLLSKFGLDVADKLTLSVSRRRFAEDVGSSYNLLRPMEGDLVYFPLSNGMFEIKFVEHEAQFYQAGALQYYQLQLEKFNYSNEQFNTGIQQIDAVMEDYSVADDNFVYLTENGYSLITENGYDLVSESYSLFAQDSTEQNDYYEEKANTVIDFSITSPFGQLG